MPGRGWPQWQRPSTTELKGFGPAVLVLHTQRNCSPFSDDETVQNDRRRLFSRAE